MDREGDFYIFFFFGACLHIVNDIADIYSFLLFIYQAPIYHMPLGIMHDILRLVDKTEKWRKNDNRVRLMVI